MSRMKLWTLVGLVVIASMMLSACATPEPQTIVQTVVVKEKGEDVIKEVVITVTPPPPPKEVRANVLKVNYMSEPPTIDPNISTDTTSVEIVEACFVGLTRLHEVTSALEPGMATHWDISDDGKTYTFHIRNDIPWVRWAGSEVVKAKDEEGNDRMVTAYDFEYGIIRALKPETASSYAYVLGFAIAGAQDFNDGVFTDTSKVGVKALDEWTLEINFLEDAVYNANIAGLWTAMAVPQWVIAEKGDRWTEPGFYQSYGPYTVKEWIHDSSVTLIKNPFWPGTDAVPVAKIDEVQAIMVDESSAMAEFEAGNLDAVAVPSADLDRVKADPDLSKLLKVAPVACSYYYGINTKAEYVNDVRVRRALSLALDRVGLVENVLKGGQEPAGWFCRPGMAACPTRETHPDLGPSYNPDEAKKLLQEYLDEKGLTAGDLDITIMFNTSQGHQKIAEAIQQMWKNDLGIEVQLSNQEWKVYLTTIRSVDTPQVWRLGWCMDYPDSNNWSREVFSLNGSSNPAEGGEPVGGVNWYNERFEEVVKAAAVEKDPAKRLEMYAEAEKILNYDDAAIIPIYWYSRNTLTQPWLKRTFSVGGHARYEKWEILQDQ